MRFRKNRSVFRYICDWVIAVGTLFLLFHLFEQPLVEHLEKKKIGEVWETLMDFEMDVFLQDEALEEEDLELLEELEEKASFIICGQNGELLYSNKAHRYGRYRKLLMQKAPLYGEEPLSETDTGTKRHTLLLLGRTIQDDETLYICVYRDIYSVLAKQDLVEWSVFWTLLASCIIILFILYLSDRKEKNECERTIQGLKALTAGNLSVRITTPEGDDMLQEITEQINLMADRLQENEAELDNYRYLLREGDIGRKQYENMQKAFISNVTHQLKTPLAIISSQVELNQTETDEKRREYYYNSIMEEIEKMSGLISTILADEKDALAPDIISLRPINLSESLLEIVPKYENWLKVRNIIFDAEIEPDLFVMADSIQIEQAVNNYMMNAYRHVRLGKRITLSLLRDGDDCVIGVYNDGQGIAENELEQIWERHYRPAGERDSTGAGLGLYIVRQITLAHHGSCGAVNQQTGVLFWIRLPLIIGE